MFVYPCNKKPLPFVAKIICKIFRPRAVNTQSTVLQKVVPDLNLIVVE